MSPVTWLPGRRAIPGRLPSTCESRYAAFFHTAAYSRCVPRFAELAKVLEPGKAAKTDKTNIIDDAMRIVTQLRGENGQLRQLNKFLEVENLPLLVLSLSSLG